MAARTYIKSVLARGVHGHQDIEANLHPGLNIFHGKNGVGKTTFLHIIANLAERDLSRFFLLRFSEIEIKTSAGAIKLEQRREDERVSIDLLIDGNHVGVLSRDAEVPPSIEQLISDRMGTYPVYLPAFRSILDATTNAARRRNFDASTSSVREAEIEAIQRRERVRIQKERAGRVQFFERQNDRATLTAHKTSVCRHWFGPFVPVIRYPSLEEVEEETRIEIDNAFFTVSSSDQISFSEVFVRVLQVALGVTKPAAPTTTPDIEDPLAQLRTTIDSMKSELLEIPKQYTEISDLLKVDPTSVKNNTEFLLPVLEIYQKIFQRRMALERNEFAQVRRFTESVNRFLEDGKSLVFRQAGRGRGNRPLGVSLRDQKVWPLDVLSSGERHVLTMLFSATHMQNEDGVVLIDEPELSLHVDWQRIILAEIQKQAENRQIVACTHSPEIAADHEGATTRIRYTASNKSAVAEEMVPER